MEAGVHGHIGKCGHLILIMVLCVCRVNGCSGQSQRVQTHLGLGKPRALHPWSDTECGSGAWELAFIIHIPRGHAAAAEDHTLRTTDTGQTHKLTDDPHLVFLLFNQSALLFILNVAEKGIDYYHLNFDWYMKLILEIDLYYVGRKFMYLLLKIARDSISASMTLMLRMIASGD